VAIGEAASQLLSQGANPIIRYRFTADPAESIAFSYSPLLEAVLSLHVLSQPKHHPLQHPWVRRARSLPQELRREIAAFRFAYDGFVPEFLMPSPAHPRGRVFSTGGYHNGAAPQMLPSENCAAAIPV